MDSLSEIAKTQGRAFPRRIEDRGQDGKIGAFDGFQIGYGVTGDSDQEAGWDNSPDYPRRDGIRGQMNALGFARERYIQTAVYQDRRSVRPGEFKHRAHMIDQRMR